MYEVTQSSLDKVYDQLFSMIDTLGKARKHGDRCMTQYAQEAVNSLHAAAEEMEQALAAHYAA